MICSSYNTFFETFSNKTRMKIIESLLKSPKSVNEICEYVGEEQSKVSHNLKRFMDCNFLEVERDGKKRVYSLNKDTIVPILKLVEQHVHKYCDKECGRK